MKTAPIQEPKARRWRSCLEWIFQETEVPGGPDGKDSDVVAQPGTSERKKECHEDNSNRCHGVHTRPSLQ